MKTLIPLITAILLVSCKAADPAASSKNSSRTDTLDFVSGMNYLKGYFDMYWDTTNGTLFLRIDKLDKEFLYVNSLVTGIGSNDIGLDRGQFGRERVVKFIKNGPEIYLIQPNYQYRADSENPAEKKAVEEAFARSILAGFTIEKAVPDGYLINITDFLLQDAHQVAQRLKQSGQGNYTVSASQSGIFAEGLKNFPENTVIESLLTFTGDPVGSFVRQVVPSPENITVIQRHSFVKLPDEDFNMRKFDPRAGYFGISYVDYAQPFFEPMEQRYIVRHRLEKKDPGADISEPVEPIIYYLDPGVPEPIRSALLDGARWWNEAFESAGYKDAFRVEMLPEGADMMDVRYNVIQWVHRSTRGWSYGRSVVDPRTGEIIKGHVSLGSLRVRQDFLMAQGLLSPYDGDHDDKVRLAKEMALARIRQLSAHEVGHTLGLAHNFAASVNDRASVMDYPHPLITLDSRGFINLSEAYDKGIGEWDKIAIRYGYAGFPEGSDEEEQLSEIIDEALKKDLYFISDRDARPQGSAHPYAHLWDNRKNAADELNRIIGIREKALENFGLNTIPEGMPYATLEDVLVPIYLLHRYQTEAACKLIGGLHYSYALRGDDQLITSMVPDDIQEMAIDALLRTIQPEFLAVPDPILSLIPPKPPGYYNDRESFKKRTGITFDALSAAESAADMTLELLLDPERASRLVEYHARYPELPGLQDIISDIIDATWEKNYDDPYASEIHRVVSKLVLSHLIDLAGNTRVSPQARAIAFSEILHLEQWIENRKPGSDIDKKAHYQYALEMIRKFREDPESFEPVKPQDLPPGSPIGNGIIGCDF